VALSDAPAMWAAYDAIERCATAAKTLLAERVEQSRVWAEEGHRSAAEHLARTSGSSVGAARASLETSKKLRRLPATEAAVRRAELSRAQAETITDAAAVNPGAEQSLLEAAGSGNLAELREKANRAKAAADPDPDATHRRIHRQRRLCRWTDADGGWNIRGRGTADAGALINAALDPIIDEVFRTAHREGRHESRDAYAFDALLELARRARGQTAVPATGDRDVAADGTPRRSPSPNPSFLALLRVDLDALRRGRTERDEVCDIAGVGAVPARVARSLLGDAILKLVITKGVDVVNVTHLGRGPTAAQRIALLWASPWCTNSLCSHTLQIQHDHRRPWAAVHETTLDNLDRLCGPCHKRKTHGGWALVEGKGRRPLVPPNHPRHPGDRAARPRGDPTLGDADAA
jgi:5-methylcytosine-specific restriction endonuclease McrA